MSSCFIYSVASGAKAPRSWLPYGGAEAPPFQGTSLYDLSYCLGYREQIPRFARDDSEKQRSKIKTHPTSARHIRDVDAPSSARCSCGAAASGRGCRESCRIRSDRLLLFRRLGLRFPLGSRTSASGGHSRAFLLRPFRRRRAELLSLA